MTAWNQEVLRKFRDSSLRCISFVFLGAFFIGGLPDASASQENRPNRNILQRSVARGQVRIADLRPTQYSVGFIEVKEKMKLILEARASGRLDEYFEDQTVPVIKSPTGELFMIDRHHFVRAVYELREELATDIVYVAIAKDFSRLKKRKFWKKIENYMDLYDQLDRPIRVAQIPKYVEDLVDDIFRSLAGRLRRLGYYAKTGEPFQQFIWARALRRHFRKIEFDLNENNYSEGIFLGGKWALSREAQGLPGSLNRREFCVSALITK